MASEYLKKKYKDVKPAERVELTPAEKRRNWWDYHKGWVLLGVVLVLGAAWLVHDIFLRPVPDYQVGYVCTAPAPQSVLDRLQEQLEALGEDVNGDGQVLVEVTTYALGFDEQSMNDVEAAASGVTRLTVDLSAGDVYLLLLDDPEGFQARIGALSYLDGSLPPADDTYGAADWRQMVYAWEDCPVLAELDLGTYVRFLDPEEQEIDGQQAMEGIYVGRRALFDESRREDFASAGRLWQSVTAGAAGLDG